MKVLYQGTDITGDIQTVKCIVRDCAGRSDSIELEMADAARWYSWGPKEDDILEAVHGSYNSGRMYINQILPENGRYRLIASSLPCSARASGWESFEKRTLAEISRSCAASSGMDCSSYGIDMDVTIPYIVRQGEGYAAFLSRLYALEGAVLKCLNGSYTAIGILYAQALTAYQTVVLEAGQEGALYRRTGTMTRAMTVKTPYACATAKDDVVADSHPSVVVSSLPAMDDIQAGRWARNRLIDVNRKCECLQLSTEFNPALTAMARIDVVGGTDATGQWLVESVEHDLIHGTSSTVMRRCIWSVR